MKKLYVKTYGCQMNEYDSKKMIEILKISHGLDLTDNMDDADLFLLNTCSVREKSKEKLFSELGRIRKISKNRQNVLIGVGGCVAAQEGIEIINRVPYVDFVFGPQTLHRIPELIEERIRRGKPTIDISFPEIEKFDRLPRPKSSSSSEFISIMEGCSKYCSFCIVPYTRGQEFSRKFTDIVFEVRTLITQGVKEFNFLGQNVNDYQGVNSEGQDVDLCDLITYVAKIDGVERIRFTTSHPKSFGEKLIETFKNEKKLVSHLHLPIQSGSNRILAAMKRNYTVEEYKYKINQLKLVRPDISISSDFIVGFPGETHKDFQDTINLIQEIGFDNSFSFIYSPRPGTPASNLKDEVTLDTKKRRLAILQECIKQQYERISMNMVGTIQNVLVTSTSKKNINEISGRTENNRVVNFKGPKNLIGKITSVLITEALPNSLKGNISV